MEIGTTPFQTRIAFMDFEEPHYNERIQQVKSLKEQIITPVQK